MQGWALGVPISHGLRDLSEEAIANMMRGTTEGSQMLRESAGAQYDPSTAYQEYMDPYTSEVIGRATADIRDDTERAKAGARDRAISQGAFGGSRGRLGAEEIERGAARSIGDMASRLRSQGYGQAQQQAMGEFGRQQAAKAAGGQGIAGMAGALGQGLGAFGDRYSNLAGTLTGMQGQDIGRMMQMGGMDRARSQALMDLAYQNYVGQYNMPMTLMGQYGNMLSSVGPMAGGTGYSGKWPSGAAGAADGDPRSYGGHQYSPGSMYGYWPPQSQGYWGPPPPPGGPPPPDEVTNGTGTGTGTTDAGTGTTGTTGTGTGTGTTGTTGTGTGTGTTGSGSGSGSGYYNPNWGPPPPWWSGSYYNPGTSTGTGTGTTSTGTGTGTTGAGTAANRGGLIELIRSRRRG